MGRRTAEPAVVTPLCSIWGPTCDGIDCVISDARLPELDVGAWLLFPNMGAYTACAGSNFNGMSLPDVVYLQARGDDVKPHSPSTAHAHMLAQMRADGIIATTVQTSSDSINTPEV